MIGTHLFMFVYGCPKVLSIFTYIQTGTPICHCNIFSLRKFVTLRTRTSPGKRIVAEFLLGETPSCVHQWEMTKLCMNYRGEALDWEETIWPEMALDISALLMVVLVEKSRTRRKEKEKGMKSCSINLVGQAIQPALLLKGGFPKWPTTDSNEIWYMRSMAYMSMKYDIQRF